MRFLDAAAVHAALPFPPLVEALREGHASPVKEIGRLLLEQKTPAGADHFLIWAAWIEGAAVGAKLITVFPANAGSGHPPIAAVYVLFDGATGAPVAVLDGTALTLRKTAADSALGADYLARPDCRTLLVVGAGNQAPWQVGAMRAVRPGLARVLVWNRTPAKAAALAAEMAATGLEARAVDDLAAAAAEADLITCVTATRAPVLRGEWLRPGTHVDLVGGFTTEMREADDEAIRRARVFADTRRFTIGVCGDIDAPVRAGLLAEADIADLFDLAQGRAEGRRGADEITLFKNGGGGHLDLMSARLALSRHLEPHPGIRPGMHP